MGGGIGLPSLRLLFGRLKTSRYKTTFPAIALFQLRQADVSEYGFSFPLSLLCSKERKFQSLTSRFQIPEPPIWDKKTTKVVGHSENTTIQMFSQMQSHLNVVDCPTQLTLIFMILYLYLPVVFYDKYQICNYEKHSRETRMLNSRSFLL